MKFIHLFLLLAMLQITSCAAQPTELTYKVSMPRVSTAQPRLIILLHGYGSNESDLFRLKDYLPSDCIVVAPRAPYSVGFAKFGWFNIKVEGTTKIYDSIGMQKGAAAVQLFIKKMAATYHVDARRVYLLGFSQGAMMSYCALINQPNSIRAIGAFGGRILEQAKNGAASSDKWQKDAVFIGHGSNDAVVDVKFAQEAAQFLKSNSVPVILRLYEVDHTLNQAMLNDFVDWMNTLKP
jgi:phospholipase/carboxylesterase